MAINGHSLLILLSLGTAPIMATEVAAQKHIAPGVTDTEVKVGQTMPYSGPASAWGAVGRAELAYLKMINDRGGTQRAEDRPDKLGRRLQSTKGGRADSQTRRERWGGVHL